MQLLGYNIDTVLPEIVSGNKLVINTINPHSYCVAKEDELFRQALQQSDVLLPDGVGIVYAARILNKQKIQRITGSDLHMYLLDVAQKRGLKVFYLGASAKTLQMIEAKIAAEYPAIRVATYSPPYKPEFSAADSRQMIEAVNAFAPDVLFVGMTAPKQEKWVSQHHTSIDAGVLCSVGAVFDFFTGNVKRPGKFWQDLGLEWLPRLVGEPKRLFKRNFYSTPRFLWEVVRKVIHN